MGDEIRMAHARGSAPIGTRQSTEAPDVMSDAFDAPTLRRPDRALHTESGAGGGRRAAAPQVAPRVIDAARSSFRARFWGVRGSYPTTFTQGSRIGGATTCLEVRADRHIVIVDAGSGIIALGESLEREWRDLSSAERPTLTMLFTHAHHDHLCGLPFFAPLFDPQAQITLLGPDLAGMRFDEIIAGYMRSPYFPVDFRQLPSRRTLISIGDGARLSWDADAQAPRVLHGRRGADGARMADAAPANRAGDDPTTQPGRSATAHGDVGATLVVRAIHSNLHPREGTLIYRIGVGAHSLVFATDVEVGAHGPDADARFIQFAQGTDVLAHDAQYSEEDYRGDPIPAVGVAPAGAGAPRPTHRGFGHSTPLMAADVARRAGVGQLALIHHNPAYDDASVEALADDARRHFPNVIAASEGLELTIGEA